MKKLITYLVFYIVFFSQYFIGISNAQSTNQKTIKNSFVLHGNITAEKKAFYIKSIEAADMEQFRLKTQTVTLKFKNGFLLELLSAKDIIVKNIDSKLDINNYQEAAPSINYKYPVFEILESGWLTAEIQNDKK